MSSEWFLWPADERYLSLSELHASVPKRRKPESVFDFVQGITAVARGKTQQDARLDMEGRAKKLLDRTA